MPVNPDAVAINEDLVQQGFRELEIYIQTHPNDDVSAGTDAEVTVANVSDDPRRVGLDALERLINKQS